MPQDSLVKQNYRTLCSSQLGQTISLYMQDFWLDLVCGSQAWEVWAYPKTGQVQAYLPYYAPYSDTLCMPPFAQTMGPWIRPPACDEKETAYQGRILNSLRFFAAQMKSYRYISYQLDQSVEVCLPFLWSGFLQTTRYSYCLENIGDLYSQDASLEMLKGGMNQQTRRHLQEALRSGIEVRSCPLKDFILLYKQTFGRQNIQKKEGECRTLERLVFGILEKGMGFLVGGYDKDGQLHSAAFIVYYQGKAYYIAGGGNPTLRKSQAQTLVLWHAILRVAPYCHTFDFEGSMMEGIGEFFRGFGAKARPYSKIYTSQAPLFKRGLRKIGRLFFPKL